MATDRPIEPAEAFALGALHGILKQVGPGIAVHPIDDEGFDLNHRGFDVYGLVPGNGVPVCIRITIEEVQ